MREIGDMNDLATSTAFVSIIGQDYENGYRKLLHEIRWREAASLVG
jgi:hypothetical protein